jgi:hypothetical protein
MMVRHEIATDDDGDDTISLRLGFAGTTCPGCGLVVGGGTCPTCGKEVSAPDELSEATLVRRETFLSLRDTAEELLAGFDDLPRGTIPITATAMLSGFVEAKLFAEALEVVDLGHKLGEFDLDDPAAIRGPVLEVVQTRVEAVRRVLEACREIAGFAPQSPGDELQGIAYKVGRKATRLLGAFLAALTAIDPDAAMEAQAELQRELDRYAEAEVLSELLTRLQDEPSDIDTRLSHALARPGVYSDTFGTVDLGRVFGAFSDSGGAFLAVGRRAVQYFSFVLEHEPTPEQETNGSMLLAIPLVSVVTADRPLIAHRLARLTHDLIHDAVEIDRQAVTELVDKTATEGPAVLSAQLRLQAAYAGLEHARSTGEEVEDVAVAATDAFGDLLEVTWRLQAMTLWRLHGIRIGRTSSIADDPSNEDLRQELSASSTPALQVFADALDFESLAVDLAGLDSDPEHDPLEAVQEASNRLLSAMAGVDAGYCLGIVAETLDVSTPAWIDEAGGSHAIGFIGATLFGSVGARLQEFSDDGSRFVVAPIRDEAPLDSARLLTAVAGLPAILPAVERFSVLDPEGVVLIDVGAMTLTAAQDAPERLRDLAIVSCFYEAVLAQGETTDQAVLSLAATQLVATTLPAMRALIAVPWDKDEFSLVAERLGYVRMFVSDKKLPDRAVRRLERRLAQASAAAQMASHGDPAAASRLVKQLPRLASWAVSHSKWPPI